MAAFFRAIELEVIRSSSVRISGNVADVGCGDGQVARMLRRIGVAEGDLVGFDISRREVRKAAKLGEHAALFVGDATNVGLRAGQFDAVVANGVFPVVPGGVGMSLDECARLLKPGGLLITTVPTDRFFDVLAILPFRGAGIDRWRGWRARKMNERLYHRNATSPAEWAALLVRHGFEVDLVRPFFGPAAGRIWGILFLNAMRATGVLRELPGPVRSVARNVQRRWITRAVRYASAREASATQFGYLLLIARRG